MDDSTAPEHPTDRWIPFETVFNARDVGGLPTADGTRIRRGVLYRSDSLAQLGPADAERFATLGVRTVIDLRRPAEVETHGRVPDWAQVDWRHHHLEHSLWDHDSYTDDIGVARWLADRYAELLHDGARDFATVVGLLADPATGPSVVHCMAGKDRTGLVVALVLALAGVGDDDIAADYALTEYGVDGYYRWLRRTDPDSAAVAPPPFYTSTPAEAMHLTLAELRERHGSVEAYLTGAGLPAAAVPALRAALRED